MAKSLGTLYVDLLAKTGKFETDMGRAERVAKNRSAAISKSISKIASVAAVGLTAAAVGITVAVRKAATEMDELAKTSRKLGVSVESLSGLQHAAELSGVNLDKLKTSMQKLIKTQADAATGSKLQAQLFDRLGIAYKNTDGTLRDGEQVFLDVAELLSRMEDGADKTAIALNLFGRSGADLIPMLNGGRKGIKEMTDEAKALGIVVSTEAAIAAEQFNDNMDRLGKVAKGAGVQLATQLLPAMNGVGDKVVELVKDPNFSSGMANAITGIGNAAIFAAQQIANMGNSYGFLYDEVKARAFGDIAELDTTRIEDKIAELEAALKGNFMDKRISIFKDGKIFEMRNDPEVEKELAMWKERLAKAYKKINFDSVIQPIDLSTLAKKKSGVGAVFAPDDVDTAKKSTAAAKKALAEANAEFDKIVAAREAAAGEVASIRTGLMNDEQRSVEQLQAKYIELQNAVSAGAISKDDASTLSAGLADQWAKEQDDRQQATLDSFTRGLLTEEEALAQSYMRRRDEILKSSEITEAAKNELLSRLDTDFDEQRLEQNGSFWDKWLAAAEENLTSLDKITADVIGEFSSSMGSAFESMIFDFTTLGDAAQNFAEGMLRSIVNALGQMAAQWVVYKAVQAATQGTAASAAAVAMGAQAQASAMMASLNAFASTAAIPIIGPALAPGAAAAAAAATQPMAAAIAGLAASAAASSFAGAFDAGGMIGAGKFGLVGERGPELVSGPASVIGRKNTAKLLDRSQDSSNITVIPVFDAEHVGEIVSRSRGMERAVVAHVDRNRSSLRLPARTS